MPPPLTLNLKVRLSTPIFWFSIGTTDGVHWIGSGISPFEGERHALATNPSELRIAGLFPSAKTFINPGLFAEQSYLMRIFELLIFVNLERSDKAIPDGEGRRTSIGGLLISRSCNLSSPSKDTTSFGLNTWSLISNFILNIADCSWSIGLEVSINMAR